MKLTQARVRELFTYNPRTGRFAWRVPHGRWGMFPAGTVPTARSVGYLVVRFEGRCYYVHHLICLYMTGLWPEEMDHRNGNKLDNRWSNLRPCTRMQNAQNTPRRRDNRSGHKGVCWWKPRTCPSGFWLAQLSAGGKRRLFAYFRSKQAAIAAYRAAARQYHGAFARGG